jgi:hypothetical protein
MKHLLFFLTLSLALPATGVWAQDSTYTPRYEIPRGRELVAVYVSDRGCVWCRSAEFRAALERMKVLLDGQAREAGMTFSITGVALDWEVDEGYNFLREAGEFDEVVIGRNWFNIAAIDYLWEDEGTRPAIPQVIVFEREVRIEPMNASFGPRHVLGRYVSSALIDWIKRGAPVDPEAK